MWLISRRRQAGQRSPGYSRRRHLAGDGLSPLYPQQQTSPDRLGLSAWCGIALNEPYWPSSLVLAASISSCVARPLRLRAMLLIMKARSSETPGRRARSLYCFASARHCVELNIEHPGRSWTKPQRVRSEWREISAVRQAWHQPIFRKPHQCRPRTSKRGGICQL